MSRIYSLEQGQVYLPEKGWIPYREYSKSKRDFADISFYSPRYIDVPLGTEGTEDFSPARWRNSGLKHYGPELRLFGEGRGRKRVAKSIISCGQWFGTRRDIHWYISIIYRSHLDLGYEITW